MKKYEIAKKKALTPEIGQISVYAPLVAAKAKAGQFIILRVDEEGERIPLTISSAEDGLVTVIYQKIGGSTMALDQLNQDQVVDLDDERKAAMVSNLLVVLCGSKDAQPVVNSGSIY